MSSRLLKVLSASGGEGAYEIEQSLMFDSVDEAHLARTVSSAGNQRTWTQSCWFKLNKMADGYLPMYGFPGGSAYGWRYGIPYFISDGDLNFLDNWGAGTYSGPYVRFGTGIKDPSAWYHFVMVFDTTESTDTNRIKVWINNVQATPHTQLSWPSLNYQGSINSALPHTLGELQLTYYYADAQFAEYHFLDGTVKAPTDFAETDSVTGQWIPKEYTGGSYGTNGFYLKFESGALGTDSSGQGNNLTASNLANSDVMLDSPTNNFCTYNPVYRHADSTPMILTQGSLRVNRTDSVGYWTRQTFPIEGGKWYVEFLLEARTSGNAVIQINHGSTYAQYFFNSGAMYINGSSHSTIATAAIDDVVGVALNVDDSQISIYKNGSSILSATSFTNDGSVSADTAGNIMIGVYHNTTNIVTVVNFGQNSSFAGNKTAQGNTDGNGEGDFYYSPPSGFLALCTKNLPTPTIKNPTDHFNTVLYTGTGNTDHDITGVGFQPDLNWIKKRDEADDHVITDAVRGAGKVIKSHSNAAEADWTDYVGPFLADGIRLNDVQQGDAVNESGRNYVMWNWKANGSGSANTDGSINSTVSANTTAGFSIVTFTGTSGTGTVGHGLSQAPETIWHKNRDAVASWTIYHVGMASDPETDYMQFNSANAANDNSTVWNDTAPTSTVFSVGQGSMTSGDDSVAYCFHSVEGFSKFGAYTGNGNADGPFIYTGFRPAFTIIKNTASSSYWWEMLDNKRSPFNVADETLYANVTNTEYSGSNYEKDFLSNGFKVRNNAAATNSSDVLYIYMAWAESPFKYANAR